MKLTVYMLMMLALLVTGCTKDDNELKDIFEADQSDRLTENPDWDTIIKNDKERIQRVKQILEDGRLHTSNDYYHAAMVFQHGNDSTSYRMARDLARKAVELNGENADAKWLTAASHDRYLLSIDSPQIYGTQYLIIGNDYYLRKIDTTLITDSQRVEYGVETIPQIIEFLNKQNGRDVGFFVEPESLNVIVR